MAGAGILIALGKEGDLDSLLSSGYYSSLQSPNWSPATEATLGDYLLVSPGDNVYFFQGRTVYGIGEVVELPGISSGSFAVDADATSSVRPKTKRISNDKINRWGFAFKASPHFFRRGIDMDDLLNTDPAAFKILRAFWKRSFIRFDAEENKAFKSALVRLNQKSLALGHENEYRPTFSWGNGGSLGFSSGGWVRINLSQVLKEKRHPSGESRSEMLVECALLSSLVNREGNATEVFGEWDYLAHQVPASPFKPVDYMDRIDVFGYRWVDGYEGEVISNYLVCELKKSVSNNAIDSEKCDYKQLMKYVDWVCANYAHGDYSMIEAYLVAADFDFGSESQISDSRRELTDSIKRTYTMGHDAETNRWNDLSLVKYCISDEGEICFHRY